MSQTHTGTDEPIIDAVITASDELFPGYDAQQKTTQKCGCGCQHNQNTNGSSCCGGSCSCNNTQEKSHPLEGIEPLPLGNTRLEVPLTEDQIKEIAKITARDLENDDDEPTDEEIALLQKMFGVK